MIDAQLITSNLKYLVYTAVISILYLFPHHSFAAPLWYAGGSLGFTHYDSNGIETDLAERQVPGSSALEDDKIPWHVFVGYQHNRYLAFEFGYQYLDRLRGTTVLDSQPTVSAETSRETDGFMLGINGILPINEKYTVQAMGGIYLWHIVTAVNSLSGGGAIAINFDDRTSESYKGLGIQYALDGNNTFHARWLDFNINNSHANILNIGFTHVFLDMSK